MSYYTDIQHLFALALGFENGEFSDEDLQRTIAKWRLGRDDEDRSTPGPNVADFTGIEYKEAKAEALSLLRRLKSNLGPEALGAILDDIETLLLVDERLSRKERQLLGAIRKEAAGEYIDTGERIRIALAQTEPFMPWSNLSGIAYLFFAILRIDGNIAMQELDTIRKNLRGWQDANSRVLILALNAFESFQSKGNLTELIVREDVALDQQRKESIRNCAAYLKENNSAQFVRHVYEQVLAIAKADGVIHTKEKELLELLQSDWEDALADSN